MFGKIFVSYKIPSFRTGLTRNHNNNQFICMILFEPPLELALLIVK
jgi:hypothetical protein